MCIIIHALYKELVVFSWQYDIFYIKHGFTWRRLSAEKTIFSVQDNMWFSYNNNHFHVKSYHIMVYYIKSCYNTACCFLCQAWLCLHAFFYGNGLVFNEQGFFYVMVNNCLFVFVRVLSLCAKSKVAGIYVKSLLSTT